MSSSDCKESYVLFFAFSSEGKKKQYNRTSNFWKIDIIIHLIIK